ncbi:MAG: hypothetical protein ACJA08_000313 [Cyclobacteriaceae bacterium]|jgi:hypothetical protein
MHLLIYLLIFTFQQENHNNVDKKSLALEGYDPVTYFNESPALGSEGNQVNYKGSVYYFSSKESKKMFTETPEKYIPQYGGWCAYALGLGPDKVKINPETYKIIDGKLYLFYDFKGTNTLTLWDEAETNLQKQADLNWIKITK